MKVRKLLALGILVTLSILVPACGRENEGKQTEEEVTAEQGKERYEEEKTEQKEQKVYDSSAAFEKYKEHDEILLWENMQDMPYGEERLEKLNPTITPYIAENNTSGGCVIICPGGGYVQLARKKEGYEPAEAFNQNQITAFVLEYRTSPYEGEAAMADIFRAIRYVRYHAEEFGIDPEKISVMGFSAGGHLATMAMQHYNMDEQNLDEIDKVSARPDFGILCYPVISFKEEGTTVEAFLGEDDMGNEDLVKKYSGEEQVTEEMPPVFLWYCENDFLVNQSEDFVNALREKEIPYEIHIYKEGKHGIGLGAGYGEAEEWFPTCVKWLQSNGY